MLFHVFYVLLVSALRSLPSEGSSELGRSHWNPLPHSLRRQDFLDCKYTINYVPPSHESVARFVARSNEFLQAEAAAGAIRKCVDSSLPFSRHCYVQRLYTGIQRAWRFKPLGPLPTASSMHPYIQILQADKSATQPILRDDVVGGQVNRCSPYPTEVLVRRFPGPLLVRLICWCGGSLDPSLSDSVSYRCDGFRTHPCR